MPQALASSGVPGRRITSPSSVPLGLLLRTRKRRNAHAPVSALSCPRRFIGRLSGFDGRLTEGWRREPPMLTREENELVTRVGPGAPMGNVLRRYWIPAFLSR